MATATSMIRPPRSTRAPVVSTSTTAKRHRSSPTEPGLEIIPAERQGHAARSTAAPDQLTSLHRDHGPLVVRQALFSRQEVGRGHCSEAAVLELAQGDFVPRVSHGDARPHGEEIARGRPLLALLQRAVRAAAEHRLEWVVDGLHRREEVRHFLHALRFLPPMQHGQPLRPYEMRRLDEALIQVDLRYDHIEMYRR